MSYMGLKRFGIQMIHKKSLWIPFSMALLPEQLSREASKIGRKDRSPLIGDPDPGASPNVH